MANRCAAAVQQSGTDANVALRSLTNKEKVRRPTQGGTDAPACP
eukprot:CAMPEP_0196663004 /NCGR_PEP_ID=MMETSP1086-20130531/51166_1 /TAXON_ID=77921 /ORGANISM="Cyanoptyche  gloeocystis , Strain SAG4.97" /LENGTH=43 /DNA_ID= /DNA_START= /DNA_END= /DNA_ORIENTATION=